jgi:hypothetical protein
MLLIGNTHILSAKRRCLIVAEVGGRQVAGIRALLTPWGHLVYDGDHYYWSTRVVFKPSVAWVAAVERDPKLFKEAQQAVTAIQKFHGVDFECIWGWEWACAGGDIPTTFSGVIDMYRKSCRVNGLW